jgi:hypothetical protein
MRLFIYTTLEDNSVANGLYGHLSLVKSFKYFFGIQMPGVKFPPCPQLEAFVITDAFFLYPTFVRNPVPKKIITR